jgi:hypothetical protein
MGQFLHFLLAKLEMHLSPPHSLNHAVDENIKI